jgi:hypothetical protein
MADPTLRVTINEFQFDEYESAEALKPRELKVGVDGTLYVGGTEGVPPWRFYPEGQSQALTQGLALIAQQIAVLQESVATDAELAAAIAPIAQQVAAIVNTSVTDAELGEALAQVNSSLGALLSSDQSTSQQIVQVMASIQGLNGTYATDAELAVVAARVTRVEAYVAAETGARESADLAIEQGLTSITQLMNSLQAAVATDAELTTAIAPIAQKLQDLTATTATDAELATAIGIISQQLQALATTDNSIGGQISTINTALSNLNGTYATDAELAAAIAQIAVRLPIRSQTPPQSPAGGTRWIELDGSNNEIYDQPWVWRGEWQLERFVLTGVGSGRTTGSGAPRLDLGLLPTLPGVTSFRLRRATLRARLDGAGSWVAKLRRFSAAAAIVDWLDPLTITSSGSVDFSIPSGANSLINPVTTPALELTLTKGVTVPDSMFVLSCQWAAVRG